MIITTSEVLDATQLTGFETLQTGKLKFKCQRKTKFTSWYTILSTTKICVNAFQLIYHLSNGVYDKG